MIYAITNRTLISSGDKAYFEQIEKIAAAGPDGIILREKDMAAEEYEKYAVRCQEICSASGTSLIINHFWEIGEKLDIRRIHLSMPEFQMMLDKGDDAANWQQMGVSVHSREEAVYAENHGADYLIAGHIFLTDCKKGVPARGLDFLKDVCQSVKIPVFAIGGMDIEHGAVALEAGASGVCMMSELMRAARPEEIIKRFSGRSE